MWLTIKHDEEHWDGHPIATIGGEINAATAPGLRDQLLDILHRQSPHLVLDLSQVTACDSTGLDAFARTAQRAELLGGNVTLGAAPPEIANAIRAAGLHHRLPIHPAQARDPEAPYRSPRPSTSTRTSKLIRMEKAQ